MAESKKFYWLKLKRDFFKRHDILIIEGMPNGRLIVLFYLKLMLESIDHEGELRYSKTKPYTPEMLASLFSMDVETVKSALKVLEDFELVRIEKDRTIIVEKLMSMVGYETDWAKKKAEWRESKRQVEDTERTTEGQVEDKPRTMSSKCPDNVRQEKEIEKEIEIEKELDIKRNVKEKTPSFSRPSVEEVRAYCQERGNNVDPEAFVAFYDSKGWKVGNSPMKNWRSAVITWEKRNRPEPKKSGNEFIDLMERWEAEGND